MTGTTIESPAPEKTSLRQGGWKEIAGGPASKDNENARIGINDTLGSLLRQKGQLEQRINETKSSLEHAEKSLADNYNTNPALKSIEGRISSLVTSAIDKMGGVGRVYADEKYRIDAQALRPNFDYDASKSRDEAIFATKGELYSFNDVNTLTRIIKAAANEYQFTVQRFDASMESLTDKNIFANGIVLLIDGETKMRILLCIRCEDIPF